MATLFGTTKDGELVPIQADDQGRLVAQGLDGAPGAPGADGPPGEDGPPGPPGQAEWPPDPYEGAILAWLNGKPTWTSIDAPIVIPGDTIGPIVTASGDLILFDGMPDPSFFFSGRKVEMVDESGNFVNIDPVYYSLADYTATTLITGEGLVGGNKNIKNLFDTSTTSFCENTVLNQQGRWVTEVVFNPPLGSGNDQLHICLAVVQNGYGSESFCNGQLFFNDSLVRTDTNEVFEKIQRHTGQLRSIKMVGNAQAPGHMPFSYRLRYIHVNGRQVIDGPLPKAEIDSVDGKTVTVRARTGDFAAGYYLRAPEVRMAKWIAQARGLKHI